MPARASAIHTRTSALTLAGRDVAAMGEIMSKLVMAAAAALALLGAATGGAEAADPSGLWLTKDGDKIRVAVCGPAVCGTIAALKQPNDPATGKPLTDKNNPNAGLRNRTLVGVQIFNMQPSGADKWAGNIYVSDDGKQYDASITMTGPSSLKVEACASFLLCHSEDWTRTN
jgi:uncharacterized protein (DUF2147 family)